MTSKNYREYNTVSEFLAGSSDVLLPVRARYRTKDTIHVYVNNVETFDFDWINDQWIRVNGAVSGSLIRIQRITPLEEITPVLVGGQLTEAVDLNDRLNRALDNAQEVIDLTRRIGRRVTWTPIPDYTQLVSVTFSSDDPLNVALDWVSPSATVFERVSPGDSSSVYSLGVTVALSGSAPSEVQVRISEVRASGAVVLRTSDTIAPGGSLNQSISLLSSGPDIGGIIDQFTPFGSTQNGLVVVEVDDGTNPPVVVRSLPVVAPIPNKQTLTVSKGEWNTTNQLFQAQWDFDGSYNTIGFLVSPDQGAFYDCNDSVVSGGLIADGTDVSVTFPLHPDVPIDPGCRIQVRHNQSTFGWISVRVRVRRSDTLQWVILENQSAYAYGITTSVIDLGNLGYPIDRLEVSQTDFLTVPNNYTLSAWNGPIP